MINLRAYVRAHRPGKRIPRIKAVVASHAAELMYKAELLRVVEQLIRAKDEILLPILKETRTLYAYKKDSIIKDAYTDRIASGIEQAAKRFGGIQATANRLAELAVRKAAGESDAVFKLNVRRAIGIDIAPLLSSGQISDELAVAIKANVALIKSIPQQYFDRIEQSIWTNTGQGMRYDALEIELMKIDDMTKARAKLIARDQVGKINGAITQARQSSLGIDKYVWRTSNDERVRDSHAEKEGEVFSWNDPPDDTGHPGEDFQCRCTAEPYLDLDAEEERLGLTEADDE